MVQRRLKAALAEESKKADYVMAWTQGDPLQPILRAVADYGFTCREVYGGYSWGAFCRPGFVPSPSGVESGELLQDGMLRQVPNAVTFMHRSQVGMMPKRFVAALGFPHEEAGMRFKGFEFSCMSRHTEDGAVLFLLGILGVTNKRVLGVIHGGAEPYRCDVSNLVVNHGFEGVVVAYPLRVSGCLKNFFGVHSHMTGEAVVVEAMATSREINKWVRSGSRETWFGGIDVLSIDARGADYWVWRGLTVVEPRIVVVRVQQLWGFSELRTRPDTEVVSAGVEEIPGQGASLGAWMYLASRRGYRLVGCTGRGESAFFVHEKAVAGFSLDEYFGTLPYEGRGCFAHVDEEWARVLQQRRVEADRFDWVDPREVDLIV